MIMFDTKGNKGQLYLSILGISIIVLMVGLIVFWEAYGRAKFLDREVWALAKDTNQGTIIKDDMLVKISEKKESVIENSITDKEQVVGKAARYFIPKNAQLHPSYFTASNLVVSKGSFIAKIPSEWLLSVPDSMRRGDNITFYKVSALEQKKIDGANKQQDSTSIESTIKTHSDEEVKEFASKDKEVFKTTAAYVKDSNNREVVTTSEKDRFDGSAKFGGLEIITTTDKMNELESAYKEGYKFIIMYSGSEGKQ